MVLASASPRRADVLTQLGLSFTVEPADVEEVRHPGEAPESYVERLAASKAQRVAAARADALVIGGDTVVVHGDRILEKPTGSDDAGRMLLSLSGTSHRVYSGLAVVFRGRTASRTASARVDFRRLDPALVQAYVETGEPLDKAGAYGIQGLGAALATGIEGDYYAVIGLSVVALVELLPEVGLEYRFGAVASV